MCGPHAKVAHGLGVESSLFSYQNILCFLFLCTGWVIKPGLLICLKHLLPEFAQYPALPGNVNNQFLTFFLD